LLSAALASFHLFFLLGGEVRADASFPSQTVRIVVAQAAGSISDALGRLLADKLAPVWKQSVVVENRPGIAGTASVAQSAPDGYTILIASNGHTIAHVINKDLAFHPVKDFAAVTQLVDVPLVMIVPPDSPAHSLKEWVELARQQPGKLNFASAGLASSSFLIAESVRQNANINIVHVPYRGASDAVSSVLRGDTAMYFAPVPMARELGLAKKARVLAVSSAKRNPSIPDVPTIAEAGLPNFNVDTWFGVLVPAATPRPIIEKLQRDISQALNMPDIIEALQRQGMTPAPSSSEAFSALMKSDAERYGGYLRKASANAK
jgi:tripartite-type tricarboxylate transporter receptor subunit TctC